MTCARQQADAQQADAQQADAQSENLGRSEGDAPGQEPSALPLVPDGMRSVLVACAMVEDEVARALEETGAHPDVEWVERGYHDRPDTLRNELQRRIDAAEARGADVVLLAYGLCGNGTVGLRTGRAWLAIPRYDDCVNLMLSVGERTRRALADAGVMYLTGGWSKAEATDMAALRERYVRRFGERRAGIVMRGMFGGYRGVSVIETGCYDEAPVVERARRDAEALGVWCRREPGSIRVLEKLVAGPWDEDVLVYPPGSPIRQQDFEFGSQGR